MRVPALNFFDGFACFYRGFGLLLRTPGLWPYALAPFLIGAVLLALGLWWAFSNLTVLVGSIVSQMSVLSGTWFVVLKWTTLILVWPAFLLLLFYGVFVASRIIASPFHALLAERTLIELKVLRDQPFRFGRWLRLSLRMLMVSLLKAALFVVLGLLLFVLSFVPVVNVAAAFGFLLLVAFDCTDYSFEALEMGFRERLLFFSRNFWYFSGLAASLGLVFLIPGFNFFLFPAAVAGGSELMSRIQPTSRK